MTKTAPPLGGRYLLRDELGRGGMSTVYRADDLQTGDEVAVKVYATAASFDARTRQLREAAFGSSLTHDGIVRLLDHGEDPDPGDDPLAEGGRTYLVSELVEGPTLRERLSQDPCTPDDVCVLGARLASVLGYLHSVGIVHRDIKPANVLLPGYSQADLGKAKLTDLGVAIRLEDTRVTVEGSVVGTATYLSPEQVSGAPITPATDIYALGLVLIEAMTGVASFEGSGVECALARLHRPPAVPVSTPQWLAALLAAMTVMEPERRPDATAVANALRDRDPAGVVAPGTSVYDIGSDGPAAAAGLAEAAAVGFAEPDAPTSVLAVAPPTTPTWSRPTRWMLWAGAAAVLLVLVGLAFSDSGGGIAFPRPNVSTSPSVPAGAVQTSHPAVAVVKSSTPTKPAVTPKPAAPPARKHHGGGGNGHGGGGDG